MVVVYLFTSFVGAALMALGLWQASPMVALVAMPFGSSLFAAATGAAFLALRSEHSIAHRRVPDGVIWY